MHARHLAPALVLLLVGCPTVRDDDDSAANDDDSAGASLDCVGTTAELPGPATVAWCDGQLTLAYASTSTVRFGRVDAEGTITESSQLSPNGDGDAPQIGAGPDGHCLVVWSEVEDEGQSGRMAVLDPALERTLLPHGESDNAVSFGPIRAWGDRFLVPWTDLGSPVRSRVAMVSVDAILLDERNVGDTGARAPAVAGDGDRLATAWVVDRAVRGAVLSDAGAQLGNTGTLTTLGVYQTGPLEAVGGGFTLVFVEQPEDAGVPIGAQLHAARVSREGVLDGVAPVTDADEEAYYPAMDVLDDGLLLAWQQTTEEFVPGSTVVGADVMVQRLDASGAPVGEAIGVSGNPRSLSFQPQIAVGEDEVAITWQDWSQAEEYRTLLKVLPRGCWGP